MKPEKSVKFKEEDTDLKISDVHVEHKIKGAIGSSSFNYEDDVFKKNLNGLPLIQV